MTPRNPGPAAARRRARRSRRAAQRGLTLLELLVVAGILSVVAGIGVASLTGVEEDAQDSLARTEMRNLANAILAFRRDSGHWPRQGPFAAAAAGTHPADMSQLFTQPVDGDGDAILPWAAAAASGWNGPYLSELDGVSVAVGPMNADGTGSPVSGAAVAVRGVGDVFAADADGAYFVWSTADGGRLRRIGRPILFINAPGAGVGCTGACLVSFGPNGAYDGAAGDDLVVELGPPG